MQLTKYLAIPAFLSLSAQCAPTLDERQGVGYDNYISVDLYSDGDCQDFLASYTVTFASCFADSPVGWSSMIATTGGVGGTVTAYSHNDCGCPTCGSHGYDVVENACLKDFGFVANAVGYGA